MTQRADGQRSVTGAFFLAEARRRGGTEYGNARPPRLRVKPLPLVRTQISHDPTRRGRPCCRSLFPFGMNPKAQNLPARCRIFLTGSHLQPYQPNADFR